MRQKIWRKVRAVDVGEVIGLALFTVLMVLVAWGLSVYMCAVFHSCD